MVIIGNRGIPANYGGFETFSENLIIQAEADCAENFLCVNSLDNHAKHYQSRVIYSMFSKDRHPMLFYLNSLFKGARRGNDLLVTGTAGSFFYPLLKLFYPRVKIHTNIDGLESRRQKWGRIKQILIKFSEHLALVWSDTVICDSQGIYNYIHSHYSSKFDHKSVVIEYGAVPEMKIKRTTKDYFLIVARFVPENNIHLIIEAANKLSENRFIFIGDHENVYGSLCKEISGDNCEFVGGVYDKSKLREYRLDALGYIHGHSVGGTNPSLLEAMACGNYCILHDNEFNREVCLDSGSYWLTADDLVKTIVDMKSSESLFDKRMSLHTRVVDYYNWERIYKKYKELVI